MIIGEEKIHEVAHNLISDINREDNNELVEIDEVMVIVAVHYGPDSDNPDAESGQVFYRSTSARPHVQFGLLKQTDRAITNVLDRQ